jgi:hypothetical protein
MAAEAKTMKLQKLTLGFILPLWLSLCVAAFGSPRPQEEKKPDDNRQEQLRPENRPQPRGQEQPRTQSQPKPQEQPRQDSRPQSQAQPRDQEQPRTQPPPKPQERPRQQQARPQEEPKPNENRAPSKSNAGRQEQSRPSQPTKNRSSGGERESAGGRPQQNGPQQNAQQRARSYSAAKRVPQDQERTIFQQRRASNWGADHRDWRSRGGYVGFLIPDASFGLYFGRAHYFHVWGLPLVYVGGYPEFQYQGYWFELLDPVPPDWAPDWYQTDQVYIDWDPDYGGYYLYDASHPGESLAVDIAA